MRRAPRFTVGIVDDVSGLSLAWHPIGDLEPASRVRALFFGLGADGTVGANKNSIKIIGELEGFHAQGYFVYDSKKSGSRTVSHLRFGPEPIDAPWLIEQASFIGCHQWGFVESVDLLEFAAEGATLLLNAPHEPDRVWAELPERLRARIRTLNIQLYCIDGDRVAERNGMGNRINTIMQTCFFALAGILPRDEAIALIKESIEKSYARKGPEVVARNFAAVDDTLAHLHRVAIPAGEEQISDYPLPLAPGGQRVCPARHRRDAGGAWRSHPGLHAAGGWHLPHRHQPLRETGYRPRDPDLALRYLYPVRQLRLCLPPCGAASQVLPSGLAGERSRGGAVGARHCQGLPRQPLHIAALSGRLHRLWPVRAGLSGAGWSG